MQHPLRQQIEEIIPLTDEEFELILGHFQKVTKRKHQYLVQEGDIVNKEFWVVKGCLKNYCIDDSNKYNSFYKNIYSITK